MQELMDIIHHNLFRLELNITLNISINPSFDTYVKGDVFALGVVLFLLMERREPFELNPEEGVEPYHQFNKPTLIRVYPDNKLQRLVSLMLTGTFTSDEMIAQFTTTIDTELI
jgi:hypothetical protein